MPQTGSPPQDEQQNTRAVSPLTFLPASRCSTPGTSSLDGSPRYLFALPPPPPRPRSASPLGMAIKPRQHATFGHQERRSKVKPNRDDATGPREVPTEPPKAPTPPEDVSPSHVATMLPSLNDLTQLCQLEHYQARECKHIQDRLYQAQNAAARASRLAQTARSIQRTLAECIKSEDKHSFLNLCNAFHDALDCTEAPSGNNPSRATGSVRNVDYPNSFLDAIGTESRTVILDFIGSVRRNGNFLADRLAALTHKELVSLLPEKGQPRSTESIFGSSPRTSSRTSRHLGFVADGQTELLASFEYGSPLETLIFSVRGMSNSALAGDALATDLWSTVCARLISEQKPGFERFVPAVINMWALSSSWPGKERLSMWISQVLQDGIPLLEQPSKQSFRVRTQGPAEAAAENEAQIGQFWTNSVNSLLALLGDRTGASVLPEGALKMCQAISRKLKPSYHQQQAFPNFMLTRWLFSSFLLDAITLPEIHGLMTDHYFTENARKQVLREIAGRTQRTVFDFVYSWKHGTAVPEDIADLVRSVTRRFTPSSPPDQTESLSHPMHEINLHDGPNFVLLSLQDVNTITSALCPRRRLESVSSEFEPPYGGLQSSASSVSGLSLFQNTGSTESVYRIPTPWSSELQQPMIPESFVVPSLENGYPSERVDSLMQSEWDSSQLWEACAGMEDSLSNDSSAGPGAWCLLLERAGHESLCTVKDALLFDSGAALSDTPASSHSSPALAGLSKHRDIVEDLLSNGDLVRPFLGVVDQCDMGSDNLVDTIRIAFDNRISNLERDSNLVAAHSWSRKRRNFNALVAEEPGRHSLFVILSEIKLAKEQSLTWSDRIMNSCAAWIRSLINGIDVYGKELLHRSETVSRLRDKMWYVAEIRPSAAYEEVRLVAAALKVMGKPKAHPRTRLAPPLRHWSGARISSAGPQAKTEAQTLEIISTPPDYGGPNKLSDDQSKSLLSWMERNTVENLCMGEERIHKLCMEIRKAVDQITVESSPLLSSALFVRERATMSANRRNSSGAPFWPLQSGSSRLGLLSLQTNVPRSIDSLSSASSHPLSARSSREYLEARSPALTNRSSAPFWSPVMTEARSPSSATSVGSSQTRPAAGYTGQPNSPSTQTSNQSLLDQLRRRTLSLLLSEFNATTFIQGSETDRAFWTGPGGDLTSKYLSSLHQNIAITVQDLPLDACFDFNDAFRKLMDRFQSTPNPFVKLDFLLQIDTLLSPFMAEQNEAMGAGTESQLNNLALQKLKRQGSSQANIKIEGFRRLLCDSSTRPAAIFRDLQYIAALVPSTTLETTPQGKAFWNAAVAASSLKQEVRLLMVETADGIISFHSNNRGHGRAASMAQQERDSATFSVPSRTPSAEDFKRYTMADAAYLLQITAKEGNPAAQRELATLYLTHPELMDHIIAPFSRPRDVFKEELESKWRKNQDPNRCDPMTMCVAHHWMSVSAKGGDALAKEYLRQREEMDRLG